MVLLCINILIQVAAIANAYLTQNIILIVSAWMSGLVAVIILGVFLNNKR
jgi:hypothetical protein